MNHGKTPWRFFAQDTRGAGKIVWDRNGKDETQRREAGAFDRRESEQLRDAVVAESLKHSKPH